jgi:asparagine synthase (glutamine-hydrolysing)
MAILDAYARYGKQFCKVLDGEYAIALVDIPRRSLLLAVDPFGVKPLFVAEDGDAFGASSYRSGLVRAGHRKVRQLPANTLQEYSWLEGRR